MADHTTTVLVPEDALRRYVASEPSTEAAARAAVHAAAGAVGGEVRSIDLGVLLLEACPTLRTAYGVNGRDGLDALVDMMREGQAGEIWGVLGGWCAAEHAAHQPPMRAAASV